MKKSLLMFLVLLFINSSFSVDCPYGLVNDPYPGECARYIDLNNDGYCDLSQDLDVTNDTHEFSVEISGSELKAYTLQMVADLYNISVNDLISEINIPNVKASDTVLSLNLQPPSLIKTYAEKVLNSNIYNSAINEISMDFNFLTYAEVLIPLLVLALSIISPLVLHKIIKIKPKANLIIDLAMIALSLVLFITSIFKWLLIPYNRIFLLGLAHKDWMFLHDYSGMILSGLVLSHILLHWNWLKVMLFGKK
ncbi:MAG: DUF4405 domain-containing protein [Candidatus Nanoarchaeia archaeon]|jgi:hypothetical protein